jgi:hypothetical protein
MGRSDPVAAPPQDVPTGRGCVEDDGQDSGPVGRVVAPPGTMTGVAVTT